MNEDGIIIKEIIKYLDKTINDKITRIETIQPDSDYLPDSYNSGFIEGEVYAIKEIRNKIFQKWDRKQITN